MAPTEGETMTSDVVCRDQSCPDRHCICCNARHIDTLDQTCIYCLGQARRWLHAIPDHAAQIVADNTGYPAASPGISERTSRNADTPLMGGDKTSLTGPGGDGRNASGHPWNADNQPTDPPSVLAQLESWERDWRETMHLAAAMTPATLTNVTGFLLDNLGWAAQHHPAFSDFWAEVRQLAATLEHAAGHTDRPIVAVAECFDCPGIRLHQQWTARGLDDEWTCPRCKRRYLAEDYYRARTAYYERLRDKADAQEGAG